MADLKLAIDTSTAVERAAVAAVIAAEDVAVRRETERLVRGGLHRRAERRHLLLPGLHALQRASGWISPGGLNHLCDLLQVPPADAYGVATFYALFRTDDPGHTDPVHHVCMDPACHVADAENLAAELESAGHRVHRSPCLGQCERAPAQFVQGIGVGPTAIPDHVPADSNQPAPPIGRTDRLLARVGLVDPTSLDSYIDHRGYEALAAAVDIGPAAVIELVDNAGLTGRGGAAFPTSTKWRGVAAEGRPIKHVIANADESEPGTFKDRVVMEHDPFSIVEGLTIAGYACGASNGWVYVRGEYPLATDRLLAAIGQARAAGLLGVDVLGTGWSFDIELRRGAGAYICGEETALMESIEGKRGEPRNKPPFPSTHGLFGQPTAVNNPETLLNAMSIVLDGPEAYRARGTDSSPGTRLFCLSGHVARPGLYECDHGITLRDLLGLAGGPIGDVGAVLLGGAAGSFVGPDQLDLPLTRSDTQAAGTTLGSGVVTVFDADVDFESLIVRIARFFRDESCGQCVPCRVGAVRQHEVLVELSASASPLEPGRRALIEDIAAVMGDASICGLGHTASSAVLSAIQLGLIGRGAGAS